VLDTSSRLQPLDEGYKVGQAAAPGIGES